MTKGLPWISVLLGLGLLALPAAAGACPELAGLLQQTRGGSYRPPAPAELEQARRLFRQGLAAARAGHDWDPAWDAAWQALGFERLETCSDGRRVQLLRELPQRREGRGLFVVAWKAGPAQRHALQAPHRDSDLHSGDIALAWFEHGPFLAAAWNTVPRRQTRDGLSLDSDLAHVPASYFTAFAEAWADAGGDGALLQLHGFDPANYAGRLPRPTAAIVSAGARRLGGPAAHFGRCLQARLGAGVRLYPEEVRVLGGTTNSSGRSLHALGANRFIHLELSPALRQRLRDDAELQREVLACLP